MKVDKSNMREIVSSLRTQGLSVEQRRERIEENNQYAGARERALVLGWTSGLIGAGAFFGYMASGDQNLFIHSALSMIPSGICVYLLDRNFKREVMTSYNLRN